MPVRTLPSSPNLDHLKHQAKDLLRSHAGHDPRAAQLIREFHPRHHFRGATDPEIFHAALRLSDAQLIIAREHGFASWTRLKSHVETPTLSNRLALPHQERIDDPAFRVAVQMLDAGDTAALRAHLKQHPKLTHQHVLFEGGNYFRNPTLLEFIAENPIRHGTLPSNIVEVATIILHAGVERAALDETLLLVATGSVPRECRLQLPLISLLCDHGADRDRALQAAVLHGELEAARALMEHGAKTTLPIAAALGDAAAFERLLPRADGEDRHLALVLASQFGHNGIVTSLLDAGEDPNRYNPVGGHSHTTPLHQAAFEGNDELVRLLIERGARVDLKDVLWRGTPADWAHHGGRTEIEAYLRALEAAVEPQQ